MADFLSTRDLPEKHQFEAWRAWLAGVFDVGGPPAGDSVGFSAEVRCWAMGGLTIALGSIPASRVSRTAQLIRRNPIDHWALAVPGKDIRVISGASDFLVRGQVPFLNSMAHPFSVDRPPDQHIVVYLPRDGFPYLSRFGTPSGVVLETSLAELLANFLWALVSHLPELSEIERLKAGEALRVMVNACVTPSADHLAEAAQHLDVALRRRIQNLVKRHLTSADLNASMLCRAARMSRSRLYRLLQSEGGVARHIQRERLLACRRLLMDPTNEAPVHRIAQAYGFADPSAFSRSFLREFGITPSEVRSAGRSDFATATLQSSSLTYASWDLRKHLGQL